jgi:hypothetical protein
MPQCNTEAEICVKKLRLDARDLGESIDFRFLRDAPSSEIEAACKYEYMRESQALRDVLDVPTEDERKKKAAFALNAPFFRNFTERQFFRLILSLQRAGFPRPWKNLAKRNQRQLVSLLAGSKATVRGDKELNPPVIIEQGGAEFDQVENCWRVGQLEPFELSLFKEWDHSGRRYFFGFVRIDCGYNETETIQAFKYEFRKLRKTRTKSGGKPVWRERLKQLAVMRLWNRPNPWQRLQFVAKFCGYKACAKEVAEHKERAKRGHAEPMGNAAKVQMSRAREEAVKYFQCLFPSERPISSTRNFAAAKKLIETRNQL